MLTDRRYSSKIRVMTTSIPACFLVTPKWTILWLLLLLLCKLGAIESLSTSLCTTNLSIPGIWKLYTNALPYQATLLEQLKASVPNPEGGPWRHSEILLKFKDDGTFRQWNEGYREGKWITGYWNLCRKENKLSLALNRQYYGPNYDMLLEGKMLQLAANYISNDINDGPVTSTMYKVEGDLFKGKYGLPRSHELFFEQGLNQRELLGDFRLEQHLPFVEDENENNIQNKGQIFLIENDNDSFQ